MQFRPPFFWWDAHFVCPPPQPLHFRKYVYGRRGLFLKIYRLPRRGEREARKTWPKRRRHIINLPLTNAEGGIASVGQFSGLFGALDGKGGEEGGRRQRKWPISQPEFDALPLPTFFGQVFAWEDLKVRKFCANPRNAEKGF